MSDVEARLEALEFLVEDILSFQPHTAGLLQAVRELQDQQATVVLHPNSKFRLSPAALREMANRLEAALEQQVRVQTTPP